MPLSTGSRLGPYEVLSPLGAGGMGEVYRARDPRLGRDVAVKVRRRGALSRGPSVGLQQVVEDLVECVDAPAAGDPLGGEDGAKGEPATRAGSMLDEDLVPA